MALVLGFVALGFARGILGLGFVALGFNLFLFNYVGDVSVYDFIDF